MSFVKRIKMLLEAIVFYMASYAAKVQLRRVYQTGCRMDPWIKSGGMFAIKPLLRRKRVLCPFPAVFLFIFVGYLALPSSFMG